MGKNGETDSIVQYQLNRILPWKYFSVVSLFYFVAVRSELIFSVLFEYFVLTISSNCWHESSSSWPYL